jgi:hypothetical protein
MIYSFSPPLPNEIYDYSWVTALSKYDLGQPQDFGQCWVRTELSDQQTKLSDSSPSSIPSQI